jgi:hypothetical protein
LPDPLKNVLFTRIPYNKKHLTGFGMTSRADCGFARYQATKPRIGDPACQYLDRRLESAPFGPKSSEWMMAVNDTV